MPAPSGTQWRGRAVTKARQYMADQTMWPATCVRCTKPVQITDNWVVGHIKARATHPGLMWEPSNWQIEHRKCSDKTGTAGIIAKAKADALREAGFPQSVVPRESPPLPLHTREDQIAPVVAREDLSWASLCQGAPDWLTPYLDVPENAAPPLWVSGVHQDAVDSYGAEAIEWMESNLFERGRPLRLRWWQRLAIVLQLQHRADGSLCWRVILESGPRRIGKSVRLRGMALWRLCNGPEMFEPEQLIVHTGKDLAIVREVLRKAWPWADAQDGWSSKRGMTEPEVSFHESNRWVARSKDATTGYDCCLALVDEAWDVPPSSIDDDLEPSMLERVSPQLLLTSTAHRRATSLMRGRISQALVEDDGETLLLIWAAPPGSNPGDLSTWRAASPYWSTDRHKMIAGKYRKALAGEDDPEFDDPNPMRGFTSQYLNVWRFGESRTVGNAIVETDAWNSLVGSAPTRPPDSVAVEAHYSDGVSVASAWKPQDGPVIVSVTNHPDLPAAAAYAATLNARRPVLVGSSLADHAAWKTNRVRLTKVADSTKSQVADFIRFIGESAFVHDGGTALTDQVLAVRVSPGVDGPSIKTSGRADAVKAATWAVEEAMHTRPRMVLPSRYKR